MTKIISYNSGEGCSTYGLNKDQELIPKIRDFLGKLGEKNPESWFKEYEDETQGGTKDANIKDIWDSVYSFEYKDYKVFLFFGMHKMYLTLVYDKKNRESIINTFMKVFNPEQVE